MALTTPKIFLVYGVILWYLSSIMVNVHWKSTLAKYDLKKSTSIQHYQYAMFFTTIQFAAGALASFFWIVCTGRLRDLPPFKSWWLNGIIIGSLFYFGQLSTNMSLTMSSVTLTHMVKTLEPLLALFWDLTILKSTISRTSIIYVQVMLAGVILTSYTEGTFSFIGVIFAIVSNVSLSLRNLFIKLSNKNEKLTESQLFFISCLFGFFYSFFMYYAFCLAISTHTYYHYFSKESFTMGVFFSGQHIFSYVILYYLTITSHALLNCLKRALIIFMSAIILGVKLPIIQVIGIIITIFGSTLYTFSIIKSLKSKEGKEVPEQSGSFNKYILHKFLKPYKFILVLPLVFLLILTLNGNTHFSTYVSIKSRSNFYNASLSHGSQIDITPLGFIKNEQGQIQNEKYTKQRPGNASVVWAFDAPLRMESLEFISNYLDEDIINLRIFCSNVEKCQKSVINFKSKTFSIEILQIKAYELSKNTPLSSWVTSHPINKIKSLTCFPTYFHKIMYLSVLWKYGGIVIDMALYVNDDSDTKKIMLDQEETSAIICNLLPNHKYTEYLIGEVLKLFVKNPKFCSFDSDLPKGIGYIIPQAEVNFGLLGYGATKNLGDEMQSIGSAYILPHIHTFINRQTFTNPEKANLTYIGNAYWDDDGILFKNISNLVIVPVSVHISLPAYRKITASKSLLNAMAPIGARDLATYEMLNKKGIQSYFSGCITLWMKNPYTFTNFKRSNQTIIVDLTWKHNPVPKNLTIKYMTHLWNKETNSQVYHYSQEEKYTMVYEYLMQYAQARVVVTSRIHVALPCVALGTPVIFVSSKEIWDSNKKTPTSRFSGLMDLFHTVDLYTMNEKSAFDFFKNFNWENPPPNPNPKKVEVLKKKAKKTLERIPELAVSLKVLELI